MKHLRATSVTVALPMVVASAGVLAVTSNATVASVAMDRPTIEAGIRRKSRTRSVVACMAILGAIGASPALALDGKGVAVVDQGASPATGVAEGAIAFDRFDAVAGAEGDHLGAFIVDGAGTNERIIPIPFEVFEVDPSWSSDGEQLLVNLIGPTQDRFRPAIANPDGSALHRVEVDTDLHVTCSDWSPDGSTLLCTAGSDGHPEVDGVYTVRTDGTDLVRLTTSPYHYTEGTSGQCGGGQGRGVYSPDGSQIAFIEQRCGSGPDPSSDESAAIELMNSDGTDLHEIVPQGGVMSHPGSQLSWSPDGTWIALNGQNGQLYLVHPDGTGLAPIPVTDGYAGRWATGPDWSPDGTRIVFSMYQDAEGSTDLYTIAPNGSDLQRVTDTHGAEANARWAPLPPAGG